MRTEFRTKAKVHVGGSTDHVVLARIPCVNLVTDAASALAVTHVVADAAVACATRLHALRTVARVTAVAGLTHTRSTRARTTPWTCMYM